MIEPKIYATYMTAIADRLRSPVAEATIALYYTVLSEQLTTEQFEQAARKVFAEYQDFGFPPCSVFFKAIQREEAARLPPVDPELILHQISKLGSYNAASGWIYPSSERIEEKLGESVARAYLAAGATRCFSDHATTRDIASRAFARELEALTVHSDGRLLGDGDNTNLLESGE
jgi:hypothetical protein